MAVNKKTKADVKKKNDSLVKKMPHPAVEFDRDKNEAYLPQDESVEPVDHNVVNSTRETGIKET